MLPRTFIVFVFVAAASAADQAAHCPNHLTSSSAPIHTFSSSSLCYNAVQEKKKWQRAHTLCREAGGNLATIHENSTQAMLEGQLRNINAQDWSFWIGLYPFNKYQDGNDYFTWVDGGNCSSTLSNEQRIDCEPDNGEPYCTTISRCCHKKSSQRGIPWCYYPTVKTGPLPFTAWAPNEPSAVGDTEKSCVLLWNVMGWKWDNQNCDEAHDHGNIGYICEFVIQPTASTAETTTALVVSPTTRPATNVSCSATTPSQTTGTPSATALSKASPTPVQTPSASTSSQGPSESTPSISATTSRLSSVQTSIVQTTSQTASSTLSPTAGVSTPGQTSGVTTLVKTSSVLTPTLTPSLTPRQTSSLTAGVTTPRLTPSVTTSSLSPSVKTSSLTAGVTTPRLPSVTTSSQTAGVSALSPTLSIATASSTVTFPSQTASVTPSPTASIATASATVTFPSQTASVTPSQTASVNASSTTPTNGTIIVEGPQALSQGGIIGISVLIVFLVAVALFAVAYMVRKRMLTKTNEELVRSNEYTNIGYNPDAPDVEDNEVEYFNEGYN